MAEQQAAAEALCYDQDLWDAIDLETSVTSPPTVAPTTGFPTMAPSESTAPTFDGQTK